MFKLQFLDCGVPSDVIGPDGKPLTAKNAPEAAALVEKFNRSVMHESTMLYRAVQLPNVLTGTTERW